MCVSFCFHIHVYIQEILKWWFKIKDDDEEVKYPGKILWLNKYFQQGKLATKQLVLTLNGIYNFWVKGGISTQIKLLLREV